MSDIQVAATLVKHEENRRLQLRLTLSFPCSSFLKAAKTSLGDIERFAAAS